MERTERLRSQGFLDERVCIRNVWHELRTWPDEMLRRMVGTLDVDESAAEDLLEAPRSKRERRNSEVTRSDSAGKVLQRDVYSSRGKVVVTDRLDMKVRGEAGGRRLTLFGSDGRVIAQWGSATDMYMAWIDVVLEGKRSYINVDSSFAANLFHRYRRKTWS